MRHFIFSLLFLLIVISANAQNESNKSIPDSLIFISLDNIILTKNDITKNKPFLIIYYDPDCSHCQQMGKELAGWIGQYPDMAIWLISVYPDAAIKEYLTQSGIFPAKKLTVLKDYSESMHRWFDFAYVPLMLLYSKDGKLIKDFDQLPSPTELSQVLNASVQN